MKKNNKYSQHDDENTLNLNSLDKLYGIDDSTEVQQEFLEGTQGECSPLSAKSRITLRGNKTILFQNISIILMILIIVIGTYALNRLNYTGNVFDISMSQDELNAILTPQTIYESDKDIHLSEIQNVFLIDQNTEGLPNGCEAVAVTMLLKQYIPDLTPQEFASKFLPTAPYLKNVDGVLVGDDPEYVYIGDPAGKGYGIFAAGLQKGAQACLDAYGINKKCYDVSGLSDEELFKYINEDKYVVVWITMNMLPVRWGSPTWHLPSGKIYMWPGNEHCALLKAHDAISISLYDPTYGFVVYDKELFLSRWQEVGPYKGRGRQALVIY